MHPGLDVKVIGYLHPNEASQVFFQCWIYKIIMYFFPFQVLSISDEERREVIPDSRAFWLQFHPLQSYIIWLIDWLVSNNTFWYDKLNSAVTSPRLPLDKNNTFAVVKFLTVNLPSGHPCNGWLESHQTPFLVNENEKNKCIYLQWCLSFVFSLSPLHYPMTEGLSHHLWNHPETSADRCK